MFPFDTKSQVAGLWITESKSYWYNTLYRKWKVWYQITGSELWVIGGEISEVFLLNSKWIFQISTMERVYLILEEYLFIIRERNKWRVPPHNEGISLHFRYVDIWRESTLFWKNISSLFESKINEEFHLIMKEYLFILDM